LLSHVSTHHKNNALFFSRHRRKIAANWNTRAATANSHNCIVGNYFITHQLPIRLDFELQRDKRAAKLNFSHSCYLRV
jgi:hypothetical protein